MSRFLTTAVLAVLFGGLALAIGCNKPHSEPAATTGPAGPRAGH